MLMPPSSLALHQWDMLIYKVDNFNALMSFQSYEFPSTVHTLSFSDKLAINNLDFSSLSNELIIF